MDKITISGTGCALADFIYTNVDFDSKGFIKYQSKLAGDGGLNPGKLIFTEELEKFSGMPFSEVLEEIVGNREPDTFNLGGPGLVSLIHASQLLDKNTFEVNFYGVSGDDAVSQNIFAILKKKPLRTENYKIKEQSTTPFTYVFSDPTYNQGNGERTFVNNIGAAWNYQPEMLDDAFFNSQIVCFGGTALLPQIHDGLTNILNRAKENNCTTVVNTVYDFRNEKRNPGAPWPLVDNQNSFDLIDVLIMNCEEAIRISGRKSLTEAVDFFVFSGVSSFIITNGEADVTAFSNGRKFIKTDKPIRLPVSKKIKSMLDKTPKTLRDTTGCGDNFAGGVITSLATQMKSKLEGSYDLVEAISWAIASGGYAGLYIGGVYNEKTSGEKLQKISLLQEDYLTQIRP